MTASARTHRPYNWPLALVIACGTSWTLGVHDATATARWLAVNAYRHSLTFTVIAGYTTASNGFNFNGESNGKMILTVPLGYRVTVHFSNQGRYPHSAVVTPYALKDKIDGYPLAFPGSASRDPSNGFVGSAVQTFAFTATRVGTYALVCGVPGHEGAGMWDVVRVVRGGQAGLRL